MAEGKILIVEAPFTRKQSFEREHSFPKRTEME